MEFMDGYDTFSNVVDDLRLSRNSETLFMYENYVLYELTKLLDLGIVHCDIHQGNCMINTNALYFTENTTSQYTGRALIIDFGRTVRINNLYKTTQPQPISTISTYYNDRELVRAGRLNYWNRGLTYIRDNIYNYNNNIRGRDRNSFINIYNILNARRINVSNNYKIAIGLTGQRENDLRNALQQFPINTLIAINNINREAEQRRIEAAERERQRLVAEAERVAAETAERERQRLETERVAAETAERERQRLEDERATREAAERQRQREVAERATREVAERATREATERQRVAAERQRQREAAERERERQRLAAERQRQRLAAERERLEEERLVSQRISMDISPFNQRDNIVPMQISYPNTAPMNIDLVNYRRQGGNKKNKIKKTNKSNNFNKKYNKNSRKIRGGYDIDIDKDSNTTFLQNKDDLLYKKNLDTKFENTETVYNKELLNELYKNDINAMKDFSKFKSDIIDVMKRDVNDIQINISDMKNLDNVASESSFFDKITNLFVGKKSRHKNSKKYKTNKKGFKKHKKHKINMSKKMKKYRQ
jgi:hypothetical protein